MAPVLENTRQHFVLSFGLFTNMSEEEETAFSEDPRVQYLGEILCRMLKLKTDAWEKFVNVEKNEILFTTFFETRIRLLFFSVTASSALTVSTEVSEQKGLVFTFLFNIGLFSACKSTDVFL